MFDVKFVVQFEKYLWKSEEEMDLNKFDVYLILMRNGHFFAANPKQGYKTVVNLPNCCQDMFTISDDSEENDEVMQKAIDETLNKKGLCRYLYTC